MACVKELEIIKPIPGYARCYIPSLMYGRTPEFVNKTFTKAWSTFKRPVAVSTDVFNFDAY